MQAQTSKKLSQKLNRIVFDLGLHLYTHVLAAIGLLLPAIYTPQQIINEATILM